MDEHIKFWASYQLAWFSIPIFLIVIFVLISFIKALAGEIREKIDKKTCEKCVGTGDYWVTLSPEDQKSRGYKGFTRKCEDCNGFGKVYR